MAGYIVFLVVLVLLFVLGIIGLCLNDADGQDVSSGVLLGWVIVMILVDIIGIHEHAQYKSMEYNHTIEDVESVQVDTVFTTSGAVTDTTYIVNYRRLEY